MENILKLQQVSKTFPKSNFTLENVTFSLPYGAILGFVGENGAGKTTTIGCILNTITKDSGTVKLFGQEMLDADTILREKIGVVYDGDNFPAYWTAKQLSKVMEGPLYTVGQFPVPEVFRGLPPIGEAKNQTLFQRNDNETGDCRCTGAPPGIIDFG